jgi:streptomycin 6-kinase
MERLEPGTMLDVAVPDEDAATKIAAGILRQLWQPDPPPDKLRSLSSWCDAFDRNRASILRGGTGFPVDLFRRADALRQALLDSWAPDRPLHGDLHHFNILRAQRAEWLSIDPKGLMGDPHFDVCQYLVNPQPNVPPAAMNRRRLDIFCSELGLDRARAAAWCVVHAVLNACWYFEEERPWQAAVAYAEQTLTF